MLHKPIPRMKRSREITTPRKPPQKERRAMTTAVAEQPRGAGTGEHANATRSRKYTEETKYTPGDPAKGRIDYEKLSEGQTAEQIAMRDRRAYLINQAEKNEAANDELNAIQVDQNKRLQLVTNLLQDPDEMRDSSMETAVAALKMHDPDQRRKDAATRRKQVESAQKDKDNGKDKR